MAVNIAHAPKIEDVDEEFIIPEPTSEIVSEPAPPSQTPIFDKLVEDFFKDRKDSLEDLMSRRLDPNPKRQFIDDPANRIQVSQTQILEAVGVKVTKTRIDDMEATQPIQRISLREKDLDSEKTMGPFFKLIPDEEDAA